MEIRVQSFIYEENEMDSKSIVFLGVLCGVVVMVFIRCWPRGSNPFPYSPSSALRHVVSQKTVLPRPSPE